MMKWNDVVINQFGGVVKGASVTVKNTGLQTSPTIYSDNGTSTVASSTVTADSLGRYSFYVAAGRYDLNISGAGITAYTESDILVFDPHDTSDGATYLAFLQSGTGAVTDTTQEALRNTVVSVMGWIPVSLRAAIRAGTSNTDVATYINAAITDLSTAGGGWLYFPYGTYFTTTINGASKVSMFGPGIINFSDDGSATSRNLYMSSKTDFNIDGLTLTSTATARTGVYGLIRAEGCARFQITRNKTLTSPGIGIYIANCTDGLVEGNNIGDGTLFTYADGIHVNRQSSRIRVVNNTLRKCQDDAIAIISNKDGATYTANRDIVVSGNNVDTTTVAGNGISVNGGIGIEVSNNTVRGVLKDCIKVTAAGDATYNSATDIAVNNNICSSAGVNGINVTGLNRGTVNGNICASNTVEGIQLVGTTLNVSCVGNNCHGNGDYGIYEEALSGPNVFVANTLKNNTQAAGKLINGGTASVDANNLT